MIEKPVQKSPPVSLSPSWAHQALGKRTAPILQSSFLEMLVRFSKQFSSSHIQPPNTPMLGRYDSHNTFGPQRDLATYPRSWGVFNKSRNPAQVSSSIRWSLSHVEDILPLTPSLPLFYSQRMLMPTLKIEPLSHCQKLFPSSLSTGRVKRIWQWPIQA